MNSNVMTKLTLPISVLLIFLYGCTKDNYEASSFSTGTFSGIKSVYYTSTHYQSIDTITINFDISTYSYGSSGSLDFGSGSYSLTNNAIEFHDDVARITLYSWDWIIDGTFQSNAKNDSLILTQNFQNRKISCSLRKVSQ
jgi:hypothetical protein